MAPTAGGTDGWDGWDDDDWDDAVFGTGAPAEVGAASPATAPGATAATASGGGGGTASPSAGAAARAAPVEDEDEEDDDAGDWVCLTEADLEADLADCEEELLLGPALQKVTALGGGSMEEKLREALRSGGADVSTEAFFAAPRALDGVAAELQELLADLQTLRLDAASLSGAAAHGPRQPPLGAGGGAWIGRPAAEVFGFSPLETLKPPPLEASLPAKATSLADYHKRLEALPRVLFIERQLSLGLATVDKYQDGKDIQRDSIVVNGLAVSGAKSGYAGAVRALMDGIARASADGGSESPAASSLADPGAAERSAELLLSLLNRTCSGSTAFEEVIGIFSCMDFVIVSPDSAAARPLEAAILGGGALGCAHTRYAVRSMAGDEEPIAVIDAEFSFKVSFDLLAKLVAPPSGGAPRPKEAIDVAVVLRRVRPLA